MTPNHDRWYWDPEVVVRVQELFGPSWEFPFRLTTLLSDSAIVLVLIGVLFWVRGRRMAYAVLIATMAGASIGMALKLGVDVPRPEHVDIISYESRVSPSFPSGHAMHAVAFWGMLAYFGLIRYVTVVTILAVVAVSRLFLGIHYPADIVAGAIVGFAGILAGYIAWTFVLRRLTDHQMSLLVGAGFIGAIVMVPVAGSMPLGWEILGGLLGAGTGTLIEAYRIGYHPGETGGSSQLVRIAIGSGGILLVVLLGTVLRETGGGPLLRSMLAFPLGIWITLAVPYILDRLGLSDTARQASPRPLQTT